MKKQKDRLQRVAIIGATPAGITAANKLGEIGIPVTLIDRDADLDKKFSRDEWALRSGVRFNFAHRPGLIRILRNPSIRLQMPARVDAVKHSAQGFTIKLTCRQTYVDAEKCTLCGRCVDACPVTLENGAKAVGSGGRQSLPGRVVIDKRNEPPCQAKCPLRVNAQGYIALCRDGKYSEALDLIRRDNVLPEICGRICTRPCESACRRGEADFPVAIRDLKRFVADAAGAAAPQKAEASGPLVAVIGSGPAGLAAAAELARAGCRVTVYEKEPRPGGLLRYGVGRYRLPEDALDRDVRYIQSLGVQIMTGHGVNFAKELDVLAKKFSAVVLATGSALDKKLGVPGEELEGVEGCLSFLNRLYQGEAGELGGTAAVIGDGNSAFDLARALRRLGAKVTLVSWFSEDAIPADDEEVRGARLEGIDILPSAQVAEFARSGGKVSLKCRATKPGPADAAGISWPVIDESRDLFDLTVDRAFVAIGQAGPYKGESKVPVTSKGFFQADEAGRTGLQNVYAAGDCVTGPASVVEAMAKGRAAARAVMASLGLAQDSDRPLRPTDREHVPLPDGLQKCSRPDMRELAPGQRRSGFLEVALGLTAAQAAGEAGRCLQCGICSECLQCMDACSAIGAVQHRLGSEHVTENAGIVIIADKEAAGQINGDDVIRAYDTKSTRDEDVYALMVRGYAAAAKAMTLLEGSGGRLKGHGISFSVPDPGLSPEIRVGVFACRCNDSLGWLDSMTATIDGLKGRPGIVHAETVTAACIPEGYSTILRTIREKGITRVVLASCVCCSLNFACSSCTEQRSRLKNRLFTGTGVSRSMVESCNLRGEVLRFVKPAPETAARRFDNLIETSISRARRLKALPSPARNYSFTTAVIGDSEEALTSASLLAAGGFEVFLFDTAKGGGCSPGQPGIHRFPDAAIGSISGRRGDFQIAFRTADGHQRTLQAGAVILGGKAAKSITCMHQKELPGGMLVTSMQEKGQTGIPFLYPGSTSIPGLYIADFPGVKLSKREKGAAAAMLAAAGMPRGPRSSRGFTVCIDEELCRGCGRCISHCPYQAISMSPAEGGGWRSSVDDALCKGCGNCISVCPSNAADSPYRNHAFLERALSEFLEPSRPL